MATPEPRSRNLEPDHGLASYYEYRERWAVLVGISEHQHAPWNLKYARRDAEELAKLLKQAAYGAFDESRMCILLDQEATTAALTKALRSFLKKPARNDLVLLHFSCHGTPDPDGLDEVYLVTHDTDPADIAATALPMREVRYALEHTLKAERVVILADTCHSAALISGGRRTATPNAQVMNQYLKSISDSKKGRAWLISAEANEVSLEDARWGGGHGLFTHQLIEGLKGKADKGRKGLVKIGDLFDFVYDRVVEESGNKQHPSKGADKYDRELVLAVTAHFRVEEHYELGCLLDQMGWLLDDRRIFESAGRQLEQAFRLAADQGIAMPEAAVRCGLAGLAVADGQHALDWFEKAEKSASSMNPPDRAAIADARFHRALALLDLDRPLREPLGALDEFIAEHPDDPRVPCARGMRERIARADHTRRRALLIGIGRFQDRTKHHLEGPENDVRELRTVLIEQLGFEAKYVTTLEDQAATRAAILDALHLLAQQAGPEDLVIVYFSGNGSEGEESYWVAYDASGAQKEGALGASEIHARLKAIPASRTIVIIDSNPNKAFLDQAPRDPAYTLLLAAKLGEGAREIPVGEDTERRVHGLFTWGLLKALRQIAVPDLTPKRIMDIIVQESNRLGSVHRQSPVVVGEEDQVLFRGLIDFPALFRFSRRRHFDSLTDETVERFERWTNSLESPFPRLRYGLGRAYLEMGQLDRAMGLLGPAESGSPVGPDGATEEPTLARYCAHLAAGRGPEARRCLDELAASRTAASPATDDAPWTELRSVADAGGAGRRALLVGINGYLAPEVPNPRGAVADVDALANVLKERWGFADIQVLTDTAATRSAILEGFERLARRSRHMPCLFAFSGAGSVDADGRPSLVAADSRLRLDVYDDIDLEELARIARESGGQLIAIVDAGWTNVDRIPDDEDRRSAQRIAPRNTRSRITSRHIIIEDRTEVRSLEGIDLQIGRMTMYAGSLRVKSKGENVTNLPIELVDLHPEPGSTDRKIFGRLSHALISSLWQLGPAVATRAVWINAVTQGIKPSWGEPPVIVGEHGEEELIFGLPSVRGVIEILTRIERRPIAELVPRLKRLIDAQHRPDAILNLGVAYAALGETRDAVKALEDVSKSPDASPALLAEAAYHLGRVLYDSDLDLDGAISWLQEATQGDSPPIGAYYYLGRALQDSARRKLVDLSVNAFQRYLDGGAPLGRRDEVRRLIELSRNPTAGPEAGRVPEVKTEATR
jgi:uncharacterized caspase-like protein